jgi:hypothetical protein
MNIKNINLDNQMYSELQKIVKRSQVVKLSILERKNKQIYNNLCNQLVSSMENWNNYSIINVPDNLIYVNYIFNKTDIARIKQIYETKEKFNFIDTNIKYIDGTSFLLIGYIILYSKHEFNKNKYNLNIKYIDLTEAFIQYIGIGSRILKKVSSYNKTILFPYKPIEISCEFWIKYISKFVKFTTSDTLKIYCKNNTISELKWDTMYSIIDAHYKNIVKEFSTNLINTLISNTNKRLN